MGSLQRRRSELFVGYNKKLAVALRAVALYLEHDCQQLLAIAAELEGDHSPRENI
jgi:hypothetical protein